MNHTMESHEKSSVPRFSSLSLSRPGSYSAAGRAADASIHVLKEPQPMLYSPASGLVTYQPPGLTGVAHTQWLDKISSPKTVRAKSPNSRTRAASPSRMQKQQSPACSRGSSPGRQHSPQQQQQRSSRHNSPGRLSPDRHHHHQQQQQQLPARQTCQAGQRCQSPVVGSISATGTSSLVQQLPGAQWQQHPEQQPLCPSSIFSTAGGIPIFAPEGAAASSGEPEATLVTVLRSPGQAKSNVDELSAEESGVWAWKMTSACEGARSGSTAGQYSVSGTGSTVPQSASGATSKDPSATAARNSSGKSKGSGSRNSSANEANTAALDLEARLQQHRSKSVAASDANTGSSAMSERMTLTQPYVFRWGGRIKHRHLGVCEMHGTVGVGTDAAAVASGSCSTAAGTVQQVGNLQSTMLSCSSSSMPLDADTAAAAAKIASEADRLLKMLDLRMEQHHPERRAKQLQRKAQHKQKAALRPGSLKSGWCDEDSPDCIADDPICLPQEYLRL